MNKLQHANDGYFEAHWPRGARLVTSKQLAPRSKTLDGKRIAFLWDFLFKGDAMFEAIEQDFRERFKDVSFVGYAEIGNIHGKDERQVIAALPARLKALGVNAVITAVAA